MKQKIISISSVSRISQKLRRFGKKIAFTNGTFDILHAGHVAYLQKARTFGDVLIVGLNSDKSVKSYKNSYRPINPEKDRATVLAGLGCVDYIVLFQDPTPIELIQRIKPHYLIKGSDWEKESIAGAGEVESWGGRVKRIRLLAGRSTTNIIKRIRALPRV